MRKDRLLKLAAFLETIPPGSFAMAGWVERDADRPEGTKPGQCGFSGCAVGWAVHARMFRGLSFIYGMPNYKEANNWGAVNKLFEFKLDGDTLGSKAARHLFYDDSYANSDPTPKQVAKRIRAFVKNAEVK